MKSSGILLPLFMLFSGAMGETWFSVENGYGSHPMIEEALESGDGHVCPSNIDPNGYWMSKFLGLIQASNLPDQPVTWNDLQPNLEYLSELEVKGWLKAIATGDKDPDDPLIAWPDEHLKPLMFRGFMPLKELEDLAATLPIITLKQEFNGKEYVQTIGNQIRKKRDVNGEEIEEPVEGKQRAFMMNHGNFDENLPFLEGKPDLEVHEDEFDDNGQVVGRKKRETPPNMHVHPSHGSYFTVKRLCVATHPNGTIIYPDPPN